RPLQKKRPAEPRPSFFPAAPLRRPLVDVLDQQLPLALAMCAEVRKRAGQRIGEADLDGSSTLCWQAASRSAAAAASAAPASLPIFVFPFC
ncbi:MAG: hypothetical protein ACREVM_07705, partial [Burkholderiales bacterium]